MTSNSPKISLIIAFYKNFDALELIFLSLLNQKFKDFEIIVAEDDNNPKTDEFIRLWHMKIPQKIKHVHQIEKKGFRKNIILNEAVKISESEIIVFIDGDVIPHKNLLKVYSQNVKPENVCTGRRVFLSETATIKLYNQKKLSLLSNFSLLFTKSKNKKYSLFCNPFFTKYSTKKIGLIGCNWGITKTNLLAINGFDQDYVYAGVGEDTDLRWRIRAKGLSFLSVRYAAVVYHLHHKANYSQDDISQGKILLAKKQKDNHFYCKNGIIKKNYK